MQFSFWGQTGCEYKIVFQCFVCLDLCSVNSVKSYSMQSALLRLVREDAENESPFHAQRGSAQCAWQCGLNKPRFKLGRGGAGQNITVLDRGTPCLSSILCPSVLFWRGAVLNPAPMAWFRLASLLCLGPREQLRKKQVLPIWAQPWLC